MKEKHGFRIVGDEDALLYRCGDTEFPYKSIGIYEDLATECPVCGEMLVLRVGRSYLTPNSSPKPPPSWPNVTR